MILFTFFLLLAFVQHKEGLFFPAAVVRMFGLLRQNYGKVFGLEAIIFLLLISFLMILSAPVLYLNVEILQWNFAKTDVWAQKALDFLQVFIKVFGFNLTLPILAATASFLYFSLREITSAEYLKKSIELIGTRLQKKR